MPYSFQEDGIASNKYYKITHFPFPFPQGRGISAFHRVLRRGLPFLAVVIGVKLRSFENSYNQFSHDMSFEKNLFWNIL